MKCIFCSINMKGISKFVALWSGCTFLLNIIKTKGLGPTAMPMRGNHVKILWKLSGFIRASASNGIINANRSFFYSRKFLNAHRWTSGNIARFRNFSWRNCSFKRCTSVPLFSNNVFPMYQVTHVTTNRPEFLVTLFLSLPFYFCLLKNISKRKVYAPWEVSDASIRLS